MVASRGSLDLDSYAPVVLGKVRGAKAVVVAGHAAAIQTTETPCLLWDARVAYPFQTSAQSLEILSASANDAAAGTGARTVLIETLDANYAESSQIVTLNGVTPVALTGTHIVVQSMTVISSGSGFTNAGILTLRVAGGGATQGYVGAGLSVQRALLYTVPAGKSLILDNFYINAINATGVAKVVTLDFIIRLLDGTLLNTQTNFFNGANAPLSITLPTGFLIQEKVSVFGRISAVSANDASFAVSISGRLFTNAAF